MLPPKVTFIDSLAVKSRPEGYVNVTVSIPLVLESWRESLFSYEWLTQDGRIKNKTDLPPAEKTKRETIEQKLKSGEALETPVLGIGLQDNIEIGSGRAAFLTLASLGATEMSVHILKSNKDEFKSFLAS